MKNITSLKNPAVQDARALAAAKERSRQRAFLLDGEHMVGEGLNNCPERVKTVFVDEKRIDSYASLLALAKGEVYSVPEHVLAAISQVCQLPEARSLAEMGDKLILLENVQDPGNVGTVLRTLDAAGFDGCVFTPGCADPYGPKTLRATMGSTFRVPMCAVPDAAEAARTLAENGYAVIGAALDGEPFYERGALPDKLCVIIGNEGQGMTKETLANCTHRYRLPMRGGAESLNAAVAAAIFMYELMNH